MTPGLCAMIQLFNGMQSSLTMVYDRETGAMRTLLVSPFPRWFLLGSKLVAGVIVSLLQVYAFLLIAWVWGIHPPLAGLVAVLPEPGHDEGAILRLAASLERGSEHPLAEAIVRGAEERGVEMVEAGEFEAVTGQGVRGTVDGQPVALGNIRLLADMGLDVGALTARADARRDEGETVMFVVVDGAVAGMVAVADPVKDTTPSALKALHALGFRIIMATGDNERTAKAVAARLGIDEIRADVLPQDKARIIAELQAAGRKVAMAGDGVNDAPALAQADVGIAMGTGADVAMESAGITLVKGDLMGIVRARHLSRATMRNIRQNLFFAFVYNALGVPVAAGALYPFFGILLSPIIASGAMALSSVSVIANSLRLRSTKI